MANKVVKHYYDYDTNITPLNPKNIEPDKTKSISDLSLPELYKMAERLRTEKDLENLIRDMKWNSGERDTYENPFKIDTKTPINQLYHYGILGQKWGIRRFQNKDGTRTPAGKKREQEYEDVSDDHIQSRSNRSKATKGLSNAELKGLNERLQLEKTYRDLTTAEQKKVDSFMGTIGKDILKQGITALGVAAMVGVGKAFLDPALEKLKDKKK